MATAGAARPSPARQLAPCPATSLPRPRLLQASQIRFSAAVRVTALAAATTAAASPAPAPAARIKRCRCTTTAFSVVACPSIAAALIIGSPCGWQRQNRRSHLHASAGGGGLPLVAIPCGPMSATCPWPQPRVGTEDARILTVHGAQWRRRMSTTVRAGSMDRGDESQLDMSLIESDLQRIMDDYMMLMGLQTKYAEFDYEGKKIFLDKCDDLISRWEIFHFRAERVNSPVVQATMSRMNRQLLEANTSYQAVFAAMKQLVQARRAALETEGNKPVEAAAQEGVLRGMSQQGGTQGQGASVNFAEEVEKIFTSVDPNFFQEEPQALALVMDMVRNPWKLSWYKEHKPKVADYYERVMRLFQSQGGSFL